MTDLIIEGPNAQAYHQVKGLAMEVTCSPDITNLYSNFFELQQIYQAESVALYKRYIDDIFAIVYIGYFDNEYLGEKHAKDYMNVTIAFEGCIIKWGEPCKGLAFLDLWVYIDGDNIIQ